MAVRSADDRDGGDIDEIDHESDQLEPEDTLDDRGVADVLDEGYSPAERPWVGDGWGTTAREEADRREPGRAAGPRAARPRGRRRGDGLGDSSDTDGELLDDEVGTARSGRLVASDEGGVPDTDEELYAVDIGIDGAGASAEEAAVHVVSEESPARRRLTGAGRSRGVVEGQPVQRDGDVRPGRGQVGGALGAGHPDLGAGSPGRARPPGR